MKIWHAIVVGFFLLIGCGRETTSVSPTTTAPPAFTARVTGAGRPVIFIPDLSAPGEVWDTTVAHLGGRVEAHVLEVAGFAGNPPIDGTLMPKLREGLAEYLRQHDAKKAVLVGHMFGGTVAYWLAMTEPELVGGVFVVDAPPSPGDGDKRQMAELDGERRALASAKPEEFQRKMARRITSMMHDPERAKRIAARAAASTQPVVADAFYDMMTRDLRSLIPSIRAPVLTILTTDNIPPPNREMFEGYYRSQLASIGNQRHELVVVRDSKHYVMFDQPDQFFSHLDRFLATTP